MLTRIYWTLIILIWSNMFKPHMCTKSLILYLDLGVPSVPLPVNHTMMNDTVEGKPARVSSIYQLGFHLMLAIEMSLNQVRTWKESRSAVVRSGSWSWWEWWHIFFFGDWATDQTAHGAKKRRMILAVRPPKNRNLLRPICLLQAVC